MYESITKHLPSFRGMRKRDEMHLEMRTETVTDENGEQHEIISFGAPEYPEDIEAFVADVRALAATLPAPSEVFAARGVGSLADVVPMHTDLELALAALVEVTNEANYDSGRLSDALISGFVRALVQRVEYLDR